MTAYIIFMFNPFSSLTTISNQEGKKRGRFTVAQIEQFNALAPSCKKVDFVSCNQSGENLVLLQIILIYKSDRQINSIILYNFWNLITTNLQTVIVLLM